MSLKIQPAEIKKYKIPPEDIKAARVNAGLTLKEAAWLIDCHITTWQRYESGKRKISSQAFELFKIRTLFKTRR